MNKLVVHHLVKSYDDVPVLRGASLTVASGEAVAVVGPSGSGKSTLLNIVGSLERPDSGSVRLGETEVCSLAPSDLAAYRNRRVGFVFQEHHLLPQLTALENVLLPTLGQKARPDEGKARALLERVGVAGRAHAFPAQLSGGERQRVAVARALINAPELLLCDEPTGSLDHDTGLGVVRLLVDTARADGVAVVMVTHNAEFASLLDRSLRLEQGRLVPEDAP